MVFKKKIYNHFQNLINVGPGKNSKINKRSVYVYSRYALELCVNNTLRHLNRDFSRENSLVKNHVDGNHVSGHTDCIGF